jgi:hypothetical protein
MGLLHEQFPYSSTDSQGTVFCNIIWLMRVDYTTSFNVIIYIVEQFTEIHLY